MYLRMYQIHPKSRPRIIVNYARLLNKVHVYALDIVKLILIAKSTIITELHFIVSFEATKLVSNVPPIHEAHFDILLCSILNIFMRYKKRSIAITGLITCIIYLGVLRYLEAYHHFINSKDSLDMLFLKFLFLGPPRLGKNTVRRRLMGEIVDLQSAGEAEKAQPSTGVVESGSMIVKSVSNTTAIVTQSEWSAVKSLEDEARMLFHNLVVTIDKKSSASPRASKPGVVNIHSVSTKTVGESTSSQPTSPSVAQAGRIVQQLTPAMLSSSQAEVARFQQDSPEVIAMLQEAMGSQYWNDAKDMAKAYLRMEDTGGLPELMDMLPALTIGGPGVYLLFIDLRYDLDHHYKLTYCNASGHSSPLVESVCSVKELLLSSLSSIFSSNAYVTMSDLDKEEPIIPSVTDIMKSSKSVAYIVGTHKDMVSKERIKYLDDELQKVIRSTQFYDFVEFFSEDELIVTMDNMDGGTEEVKKIQSLLEKSMDRNFIKHRIPGVWLLFSLIIRKKNRRTATLEECMHLSETLKMSSYETKVALWFLHHHAGVIMYFPNIPGLKDLIIIDTQVVYDSVIILILKAMSFDKVGHRDAKEFRTCGRFTLSKIVSVASKVSGDYIPIHKLVILLEYLNIIARIFVNNQTPFQSSFIEEEVTYIMPCVLNSATREELDSISNKPHEVCPIMVRFKCGFAPIGIFTAMVACLITNKSFILIQEGLLKNVVQFRYGLHYTLLTFVCRSTYYEIIISKFAAAKIEPHIECAAVRKDIESTFAIISSRVNYGFSDYQFAFECTMHHGIGRKHLCIVDTTEPIPEMVLCLNSLDNPEPVELATEHKVWFSQVRYALCYHTG